MTVPDLPPLASGRDPYEWEQHVADVESRVAVLENAGGGGSPSPGAGSTAIAGISGFHMVATTDPQIDPTLQFTVAQDGYYRVESDLFLAVSDSGTTITGGPPSVSGRGGCINTYGQIHSADSGATFSSFSWSFSGYVSFLPPTTVHQVGIYQLYAGDVIALYYTLGGTLDGDYMRGVGALTLQPIPTTGE